MLGVSFGNSQYLALISLMIAGNAIAFWLYFKKDSEYIIHRPKKYDNRRNRNIAIVIALVCFILLYFGIFERVEITESKINSYDFSNKLTESYEYTDISKAKIEIKRYKRDKDKDHYYYDFYYTVFIKNNKSFVFDDRVFKNPAYLKQFDSPINVLKEIEGTEYLANYKEKEDYPEEDWRIIEELFNQ